MKAYTIPLRLPGINEYQNACRRHPIQGAVMKKKWMQAIMVYLTPVEKLSWPAQFDIIYTEPNKKRDIDNITGFGSKVILDAFVKAGFLPDDGPSYVNKIDSQVTYGDSPQIEIFVKEEGDATWADMSDIDKFFDAAMKTANEMGMPDKQIEEGASRYVKQKRTKKK